MLYAFVYVADIVPLLVFVAIVAAIWGVLPMLSNRNRRAVERLAKLSRPPSLADIEDPTKAKAQRFQGLMETAKAFSQPMMPKSDLEQSSLRTKMANAGFRSEAAPMVYS